MADVSRDVKFCRGQLQKALKRLSDVVARLEQRDVIKESIDIEIIRDSNIKRFEFTLGVFRKYLEYYLEQVSSVVIKMSKDTLRECLNAGLITIEERELIEEMISYRNDMSHDYNENSSQELANKIPSYYTVMKSIFDRLTLD